jgi:hypothetical protein
MDPTSVSHSSRLFSAFVSAAAQLTTKTVSLDALCVLSAIIGSGGWLETRDIMSIRASIRLIQPQNAWQGRRDSNPRPTVLETAALPAELRPYRYDSSRFPTRSACLTPTQWLGSRAPSTVRGDRRRRQRRAFRNARELTIGLLERSHVESGDALLVIGIIRHDHNQVTRQGAAKFACHLL